MKIIVLGAGAWGTAIACAASARHDVALWARDAVQARTIRDERENRRYLPGVALPQALAVVDGAPGRHLPGAELAVVATPIAGLREMLGEIAECAAPVAWLCKGLEPQASGAGLLAHEVQQQVAPRLAGGILSGPSFAQEVVQGRPTALVAASGHAQVRDALVAAFHTPSLRIYANPDLVGVEVGGAVKNVLAIATGLCDGLELGANARAALVTRGLAEMTRLGVALGANAETFMGLSGLGDLVLTATGDLSRNRQVGLRMARGASAAEAVASLGHVAEGVHCARATVQRAEALGIEMPVSQAVVALLDGKLQPAAAVAALMARSPAEE